MIQKAIKNLSNKYSFIHPVDLEDEKVTKAITDNEEYNNLPYHYSTETYNCYVENFKESLSSAK